MRGGARPGLAVLALALVAGVPAGVLPGSLGGASNLAEAAGRPPVRASRRPASTRTPDPTSATPPASSPAPAPPPERGGDARPPEELQRRALVARSAGDFAEALRLLDELERQHPDFYAHHGFDYLAGIVLSEAGNDTLAARRFRRLVQGDGPLAARGLLRLASLLESSDPQQALGLVQGFVRRHPQSGVEREVRVLEVSLTRRVGARVKAERALAALPSAWRREAELELFRLARDGGEATRVESIELARRLLARRAEDEAATEAAAHLVAAGTAGLGREERFALASALVAQRRFAPALDQLEQLVAAGPPPGLRIQALLLIGRTALKSGDDQRASAAYEEVARDPLARGETHDRAIYQLGRIALSCGEEDAAIERFRAVAADAAPGSAVLRDVLLKLLRLAAARGELGETRHLLAETERQFGTRSQLWAEGALEAAGAELAIGDPGAALRLLDAAATAHAATAREVAYWRGVALAANGQPEAAAAVFVAVAARFDDLLALLARDRLAALPERVRPEPSALLEEARAALARGDAEGARSAATAVLDGGATGAPAREARALLQSAYRSLPAYRAVFELEASPAALELAVPPTASQASPPANPSQGLPPAKPSPTSKSRAARRGPAPVPDAAPLAAASDLRFLGLDAEAADALRASGQPSRDIAAAFAAAQLARRGGDPRTALLEGERIARRLPPGNRRELLPPAVLDLLYPEAWPELVENAARAYRVDPDLIRSIMREESRFDAGARSAAGARGLMQFIPETAARIGLAIGIDASDPRSVYQPGVAIPLGAAYLAELLDLFGGREGPAVAAYNAGEESAQQWLSRTRRGELDEFLREIEYDETRAYVDRVLTTLAAYRRRRAEQLRD